MQSEDGMKILFVCTGNICRSPMAEVIFQNLCEKHHRNGVFASGAGTYACDEMTPEAYEALKICGEKVPRKRIRATQFEPRMTHEFDHIICMTRQHKNFIGNFANVKTLDEYAGCGDIFDPFGYPLDVYIEVCKKLQKALGVLYNALFKE